MAEVFVVRLTVKLAAKLFSTYASDLLDSGDVTDEKIRQALLSDFKKIHENFDALRRKELVSAISFLETGFELMGKDEKTSKEEFRKSRDAAQMAFGIVPDATDKIMATKILLTSTFHEFDDNLDTCKSLCGKYLERLNKMPEVVQAAKVIFSPVKSLSSKFSGISGNTKRDAILSGVAEVNKCIHDYFAGVGTCLEPRPEIKFDQHHINPITDLVLNRRPTVSMSVEKSLSGFTCVATTDKYIFAGLTKTTLETPANDIIALHRQTRRVTHLMGHKGAVLSLCCTEKHLFSSSFDKNFLMWDCHTLQLVGELCGHSGAVPALCLSESYLFSGSSDCTLRVWSSEDEAKIETEDGDRGECGIEYGAVKDGNGSESSMKCVKVIEVPEYVTKLTCSRRAFLFCLYGTRNVQIWLVKTFTLLHTVSACDQVFGMIANDSGLFLSTKGKAGHAIQCWNLGSLTELATIPESGVNMVKW